MVCIFNKVFIRQVSRKLYDDWFDIGHVIC